MASSLETKKGPPIIMEGPRVFSPRLNASQALPALPELWWLLSRTALTLQAARPVSVPPASDIPQKQTPGQLQEPL